MFLDTEIILRSRKGHQHTRDRRAPPRRRSRVHCRPLPGEPQGWRLHHQPGHPGRARVTGAEEAIPFYVIVIVGGAAVAAGASLRRMKKAA